MRFSLKIRCNCQKIFLDLQWVDLRRLGVKAPPSLKIIVFFGIKLDEETISMGFLIQLIFVPFF